MNLKSRRARLPIAALGACALITGGGVLAAGSAFADAAALPVNTGGSSFVVGNFGLGSGPLKDTSYGLRITSGTDTGAIVKLGIDSAPTTGAKLSYAKGASNAPANGQSFTALQSNVNETVTFTMASNTAPTSGSVTVTYGSNTGSSLSYTAFATASALQTALEGLSGIGTGNVSVSGSAGGPYTVTFQGDLGGKDVSALVKSSDTLNSALTIGAATDGGASAAPSSAITGGLGTTDYLYVTGDVPGTYKFHVWQDNNADGNVDVDERSTGQLTMTVVDVRNATTATTDDTAPIISAATPVSPGLAIRPTITYDKNLSLTDSRGTGSGGLAAAIAAQTYTFQKSGTATDATGTDLTGLTDSTTDAVASYSPTTQKVSFPATYTPNSAGYIQFAADFNSGSAANVAYSSDSKIVRVADNGVTAVALAVTSATGTVAPDAITPTTIRVKNGTTAVTYKATVTDSDVDKSGNTVYFTVGGTDAASVTSDGTTVDSVSHIFSATTNSDGVATIKFTDGATTPAGYTVIARSNAAASSTLTAVYGNASAQTPTIASTAGQLNPTAAAGATVPLKGKLLDQFGAAYTPTGSAPVQALVYLGTAGTTCASSIISAGATTNASATSVTALQSDGTFSYTYTPTTTPVAGTCQKFALAYNANSNATVDSGEYVEGTIYWASSTAAASVTLTAPANNATLTNSLQVYDSVTTGTAVNGSLYDGSNTALAYRTVKLSGSDGVYFAATATPSATNQLVKTLDAVTDNTGAIQGAYVFYTKSGTATVTAESGTAKVTNTVTVASTVGANLRAYTVTANDVKGKPGSSIALYGKVTDVFGNAVSGATVNLTLSDSTVGTLANSAPTSDANGFWNTTITPGTNQNGEVTLTATLGTQTANKTPALAYATDGLTLPTGVYRATATITVAVPELKLTSSPHLSYGTKYYARGALLSGTGADSGATIDIYAKLPGGAFEQIDTVKADDEGEFGVAEKISKSTYFLVKMGAVSSNVTATRVYSGVILSATAPAKGKVHLSANGGPSASATLTFYRVYANGDTKRVGSKMSNAGGNGSITVSAPKGTRKYKVTFRAPGTTTGSDTDSVTVK